MLVTGSWDRIQRSFPKDLKINLEKFTTKLLNSDLGNKPNTSYRPVSIFLTAVETFFFLRVEIMTF